MNKIPVEKNKEYVVDIIDNGFEGEGIAKIDNFTIFVPGAIKGEKIKILILKVLSSHAFGKILEIIEKSEYRQEVDCDTYKRCGGCNIRHIKYEDTLKMKQNAVQSLVNKTLKNKIEVKSTIGMKNPFHYRNKAQYPLGINKENEPIVGVFAQRSHEIIPIRKCLIQNPISEEISKFIVEFIKDNKISIYNERTGKGLFRHIVIKVGIKTNEIMCILVINGNKIPKEDELVSKLISKFSNIKTIIKNFNTRNTNVILGKENINLYGNGYIKDILGEYTFKISPLSFYQVNPVQAERLYNIGVEAAKITKNDVVFDLYCGIGTISLFMAKHAKKVYGVEIVEQAISDARENSKINNIDNVEFIAGDTEIILNDLINNKNIVPNVVMVDPPRRGLDNKSIENILKIKPDRFVYISCNPATLVRDLAKIEDFYEIKEIQPVDMFPFTSHVECVAVLQLK
ncbi:MAG: 23S rRNA (uracil(1939)-C(5))-methyltransferase RlmD [Clostridia bacterium]|jgi:23S rRNA (uracil1939-C5)-methyltransferase|nr:23S rRNA (uracil(1939)-C(5))-methyltransferase RlmD [Clostridia bacterium]